MAFRALWPQEHRVEILLVSPADADYTCLRHIMDHSRWKLYWAPSCRGALALLRQRPIGVVITAAELPDGDWKGLLDALGSQPGSPSLIVSSRLADERLWAEVLNLGGYDVLLTPFEPGEVFRVGSAAWRAWKGRLETALTSTQEPPRVNAPGHAHRGAFAAPGL
jgi:DNA-binding response OmpR family regulator